MKRELSGLDPDAPSTKKHISKSPSFQSRIDDSGHHELRLELSGLDPDAPSTKKHISKSPSLQPRSDDREQPREISGLDPDAPSNKKLIPRSPSKQSRHNDHLVMDEELSGLHSEMHANKEISKSPSFQMHQEENVKVENSGLSKSIMDVVSISAELQTFHLTLPQTPEDNNEMVISISPPKTNIPPKPTITRSPSKQHHHVRYSETPSDQPSTLHVPSPRKSPSHSSLKPFSVHSHENEHRPSLSPSTTPEAISPSPPPLKRSSSSRSKIISVANDIEAQYAVAWTPGIPLSTVQKRRLWVGVVVIAAEGMAPASYSPIIPACKSIYVTHVQF